MEENVKDLTGRLRRGESLEQEEYQVLLSCGDAETELLHAAAREVTEAGFGTGVYVRGLVEFSNVCGNDCLYCGIRRSNRSVRRYTLTLDEIVECCRQGYAAGLRTFVFQSGEVRGEVSDNFIIEVCRRVHGMLPDCAITLSVGERSEAAYRGFFEAGARRFLLRHETIDPAHYAGLHPEGMSLRSRIGCLHALKRIGYQTGTGIMVGSPGQTLGHIARDIRFIAQLRPEMVGLGPYIPHPDTPLAGSPIPSAEQRLRLTLRIISILRLLLPDANIPATTALEALWPGKKPAQSANAPAGGAETVSDRRSLIPADAIAGLSGRQLGILAGANVVMPNITPGRARANYDLYEGKTRAGIPTSGLDGLESELAAIGRHIDFSRGDYCGKITNLVV